MVHEIFLGCCLPDGISHGSVYLTKFTMGYPMVYPMEHRSNVIHHGTSHEVPRETRHGVSMRYHMGYPMGGPIGYHIHPMEGFMRYPMGRLMDNPIEDNLQYEKPPPPAIHMVGIFYEYFWAPFRGISWDTHGYPVGFPWATHGSPLKTNGRPTEQPCATQY